MKHISQFLSEKKDQVHNTLVLFDMDETLFTYKPNAMKIHVLDKSGKKVTSLSNQQFNTHKLEPGHSFDFTDFRSSDVFAKNAIPIKYMIAKLKAILRNNKNVEIITARADLDNQAKFAAHLREYGIDINKDVHVRRAGNLRSGNPAQSKALIIADAIKKEGYQKVYLYDDSSDNLAAFLALKSKFPKVTFVAYLVQHDHKTDKVKIVTKTA
jgi:hypothetical protein